MGLFDVVAGIATGGLYTIGKAAYQAGNAAEEAGEAAEEAGLAIAVIGSTIQALGEQMKSTLKEAEELLTIQRLTPRSEDDLWDEEKDRLKDLRKEEKRLKDKLKDMGVSDPTDFSFDFWDMVTDIQNVLKKFQLMSRLAVVRKAINDIFYQEPGVLTNTIYNAKETLERFNTIEQPMIEDILDSLDDNLDVSEEVLQEVKKLFVIKKKVPISIADLSPSIRDHLELISKDKLYYTGLLERKDTLTTQFADVIQKFPVDKFEVTTGSIAMAGMNIRPDITDDAIVNPGSGVIDIDKDIGRIEDVTDTSRIDAEERVEEVGAAHNIERVSRPTIRRETVRNLSTARPDVRTMSATAEPEIETAGVADIARVANIPDLNLAINKAPKSSMMTMQPHGAKVSASLSTKFDGYQRSFDLMNAQKAFYFRKNLKLDRKYEKLANKWEETPGIIPQTLDELHGVLNNIRTEEQPRIDLLLDNVNATLEEAKGTVEKANDTMDSVKNALSILDFDTKYLKIGGMVIGGLVVLNLFFGLLVLIRMTLGF